MTDKLDVEKFYYKLGIGVMSFGPAAIRDLLAEIRRLESALDKDSSSEPSALSEQPKETP